MDSYVSIDKTSTNSPPLNHPLLPPFQEIYEVYNNGCRFVAEEVLRHETGSNVVMNCAVRSDKKHSFLVAGQESHCQLYNVISKVETSHGDDYSNGDAAVAAAPTPRRDSNLRNRKSHSGVQDIPVKKQQQQQSSTNHRRRLLFDIKPSDSVQTDFTTREPIQRVVRLSLNGKLMATGGTDGHLRVWHFPKMTLLRDLAAHTKELDDVDFSPDGTRVVSIGKDGKGSVWEVASGREVVRLEWQAPEQVKYLFKRCRFGAVEGQPAGKSRLFTLANPLGKAGRQRGFLQQWDAETGQVTRSVGIEESLSALTVRDDGRFVGVGTMFTGSVSIYIAYSLSRVLYVPHAHSMFVTGLEFLPVLSRDGPAISSDCEAAILSISVDNRLCVHSLQYRRKWRGGSGVEMEMVIEGC